MDELARPAIEALEARRVRYHPESQHRFAIESLEQAPDWCVSRQLWWGHQIPIWTCPDGHRTCAWPPPEACAECGSTELERDPDVLDTWFSSALWPFATLGWPGETPELERYYPGDVNVTAREIIRLWENRMIFSGLFLLGEIPFTDVIITSTVLAVDGRRMSKSLGTGIDPLEAVRKHGADATRYGLLEDLLDAGRRFSWGAIEEGGKLANKLWNVARLILQNAGRRRAADRAADARGDVDPARGSTRRAPRSRRRCAPGSTSRTSSTRLYHLTFDDFCDWYAEAIKPRLYAGDEAAIATALARARAAARAAPSGDAARDRGDLVAVPRRAADRRRRGPRRTTHAGDAGALDACRGRPRRSAAAASSRSRARRSGSSTRSSSPSARRRTATSRPSASGCARRSRAPRACSRTSASSPTRRPRSSRPSARSSSATGASSSARR